MHSHGPQRGWVNQLKAIWFIRKVYPLSAKYWRLDAERLSVADVFGFKILSEKVFEIYYGLSGNSLYEVIQKSENHGHSGAPKTLKDRYIEEDAPAGLTAVVALSKKVGVPTPVCQAILTVCSTLNGKDYYELGLNLKNLGIEHMSKEEIIKYVV